jgi:CTP:molybdopterin cytidylyltransferase MocA
MSSTAPHNPPDAAEHGIVAIVLAAGLSSRMGSCKPMLPLDGACALQRTILLFHSAGISHVLVVLGHRAAELQPVVERNGARPVINPRYQNGMYSSFLAACHALPSAVQAAFVLPADVPLVRPVTIKLMLSEFASHPTRILYPLFSECRGHPPLIARHILNEAVHGASGPLSSLLERHATEAHDVPVFDEAIHTDMDTPADYQALCTQANQRDIPSAAECNALLQIQRVPAQVVRHTHAVAIVAVSLAAAVTAHGIHLDLPLVRAAALLHDLAKGERNHAVVAAQRLRACGFDRVAEVVAMHTDLPDFSAIDEQAVVFLADKLVRNDQPVSLEERFAPALERYRDMPQALAAAQRRKQIALRIAAAVEHITGSQLARFVNAEVRS